MLPNEAERGTAKEQAEALHWPWPTVREHLDQLAELGEDDVGRRLNLL